MGQVPRKEKVTEDKGEGQNRGKRTQDGFEGCLGILTEWIVCIFFSLS